VRVAETCCCAVNNFVLEGTIRYFGDSDCKIQNSECPSTNHILASQIQLRQPESTRFCTPNLCVKALSASVMRRNTMFYHKTNISAQSLRSAHNSKKPSNYNLNSNIAGVHQNCAVHFKYLILVANLVTRQFRIRIALFKFRCLRRHSITITFKTPKLDTLLIDHVNLHFDR